MRSNHTSRGLLACLLGWLCLPGALAHSTTDPLHALHHGVAHPFTGLDHLLAMVAVGLWAAQLGGRALWALPSAFVGATALGGLIGMGGWSWASGEFWISASVVGLGLALALARRVPIRTAAGIAALCGLVHGHAHGLEIPTGLTGSSYAAGFLLATALLHSFGLGVGIGLVRAARSQWIRWLGGSIAAGFLALSWI